MRFRISHIASAFVSLSLLALTVGCNGSTPSGAASPLARAPFGAPIEFGGGPGSGLWGDGESGPFGSRLGCLPGRRYTTHFAVPNRSRSTVTITGLGGVQRSPHIIRLVAIRVGLAPPPTGGDLVAPTPRGRRVSASTPIMIPPGRAAVVESDFLMSGCAALRRHQVLIANSSTIVSYRIGDHTGRQQIAPHAARILLSRGPTMRPCIAPRGAARLVAWDVSCRVAVPAAIQCRHLPGQTWGWCTAASHKWDCSYNDAARRAERCWLPSKRQSISVRWG